MEIYNSIVFRGRNNNSEKCHRKVRLWTEQPLSPFLLKRCKKRCCPIMPRSRVIGFHIYFCILHDLNLSHSRYLRVTEYVNGICIYQYLWMWNSYEIVYLSAFCFVTLPILKSRLQNELFKMRQEKLSHDPAKSRCGFLKTGKIRTFQIILPIPRFVLHSIHVYVEFLSDWFEFYMYLHSKKFYLFEYIIVESRCRGYLHILVLA